MFSLDIISLLCSLLVNWFCLVLPVSFQRE